MMFTKLASELKLKVEQNFQWLSQLKNNEVVANRNKQNRNIKQIVGHMVDSASNNTHRIIHLQYQQSPINFPDYANLGNNDKWIAIQNYEAEDWSELIELWKSTHLHICHVMCNIDESKLNTFWKTALNDTVTLKTMIEDFPRHFNLHISQIEELSKL